MKNFARITRTVVASAVTVMTLGVAPARAGGPEPSSRYDPNMWHILAKVGTAGKKIPLRDERGIPTGDFVVSGKLAIQPIEKIGRGSKQLWYSWGYPSKEKSGFVQLDDIAKGDRAERETKHDHAVRKLKKRHGKQAPLTNTSWKVVPKRIPSDMRFKRNDGSAPSTLATYGFRGDRGVADPGRGDQTVLTWSTVRRKGGGMVRTIVGQGWTFREANVKPVVIQAVDKTGQRDPAGRSVTFVYGYVKVPGGRNVWGWITKAHTEVVNGQLVSVPHHK